MTVKAIKNPAHRLRRWQAAGLHLGVSVCIAIAVGLLLYFVWFPQPWFVAAGASTLILLLMGVDVCIGPLLTAIVFNPHKPRSELRRDLMVIIALQTIAFVYGLHVIVSARPVFVVAAVDRYILVAADQLDDADLAKGSAPQFRHRSWSGPRLVGALPPTGRNSAKHALAVLAGGKDIDQLPQYYVPYAQVAEHILRGSQPLSRLRTLDPSQRKRLEELEHSAASRAGRLRFLPVQRRDTSYTAIVDKRTNKPVTVLDIDPWVATSSTPGSRENAPSTSPSTTRSTQRGS